MNVPKDPKASNFIEFYKIGALKGPFPGPKSGPTPRRHLEEQLEPFDKLESGKCLSLFR
jgi:hypothetical protein